MSSVTAYLRALLGLIFGLVDVASRYAFRLVYGKRGKRMPPIRNLMLLESATSLAHKIRVGKLSSLEVVNSFIERMEEVNDLLNCMVADRFELARKEAKAVDELIASGAATPDALAKEKPFLGVPFTTKDCIAVKGLIHTSGLFARRHNIADEDADVVDALRKAGAIPLALTNVSELCMWWESYNRVHGRSNNPYDTNRIVGGSSGGEGCMQAAAGSAFGIGSDIGGSIRMPCFFNGVFGHKPSKFVVSNRGQYPRPVNTEQASFLGIGPMSRRAEDLLPLMKIVTGSKSAELRLDEPVAVKDVRFFYQENDTGSLIVSPVDPEIRAALRKAVQHLEKAHKIKAVRTDIKRFAQSREMWLFNMKTGTPKFQEELTNLQGPLNIPKEFLKWVLGLSKHTLIALCTAFFEKVGPGYGSPTYNKYVEERDQLRLELADLLGDDGVLLYPTHPTPAPYHNEPMFKPFNFVYTGVVNVLGLPATHVPLGLNSAGLPIGIQVIANDKCDRLCLAVATELEKAFGGWVPPEIEA